MLAQVDSKMSRCWLDLHFLCKENEYVFLEKSLFCGITANHVIVVRNKADILFIESFLRKETNKRVILLEQDQNLCNEHD